MFGKLFGNETAEKVLMYLFVYGDGYPTEIARIFSISLNMVQKQLLKFLDGGVLVSRLRGKTRIFYWNRRYPFLAELKELLSKGYEYLPDEIKEKYYKERRRPRRVNKPL
ncbi:MAG: hypothetical protein ABFR36_00435 [Acidobacteriota bacterium]